MALHVGLWTAGFAVLGLGVAYLFSRVVRPLSPPPSLRDPGTALKFAEFERDRMQSVAKGAAASSAGFLVAVLSAVVQGKIAADVSPLTLVCTLLGAVGMLMVASAYSQAASRFFSSVTADLDSRYDAGEEVLRW